MTIHSKTRLALQTTPRLERDAAMAELALTYARLLDRLLVQLAEADAEGDSVQHRRVVAQLDQVGRRYEATLDALGMAPRSRPALRQGGEQGDDPAAAALDRARTEAAGGASAGLDYAATVDPAVTAADTLD